MLTSNKTLAAPNSITSSLQELISSFVNVILVLRMLRSLNVYYVIGISRKNIYIIWNKFEQLTTKLLVSPVFDIHTELLGATCDERINIFTKRSGNILPCQTHVIHACVEHFGAKTTSHRLHAILHKIKCNCLILRSF